MLYPLSYGRPVTTERCWCSAARWRAYPTAQEVRPRLSSTYCHGVLSTHASPPSHDHRRRAVRAAATAAVAAALTLSGCTGGSDEPSTGASSSGSGGPPEAKTADVTLRAPDAPATLLPSDDPAALATATTAALFERSKGAVVADPTDATAVTAAGKMAAQAGVPLLLAGGVATTEVARLKAQDVAVVGPRAASWAKGALKGSDVEVTDASSAQGAQEAAQLLDGLDVPEPTADVVVLTTGEPDQAAAVATAQSAGARVLEVPGGDVRASPEAISALSGGASEGGGQPSSGAQKPTVVALGNAFGPQALLETRVATAATGVLLPDGDQVVYPGERLVALYGTPGTGALGVLGEQGIEASIARAQQTAAAYDGIDGVEAMPAFEMIATVASSAAGKDGDRSDEVDPATFVPWIEAARDAGVYVVLDLQPGTTDFLTQAKLYQSLLEYPNVGLALDPEWRLKPGQRHLQQIGSVGVDEVNAVGTWLSEFTAQRHLPQKVFLLHQFRTSMIEGRERLDTSRDELAYVIHADGNGGPTLKAESYAALVANAPPNVHWGWKNFYDEDSPTLTPQQTLAQDPVPEFVSYQ